MHTESNNSLSKGSTNATCCAPAVVGFITDWQVQEEPPSTMRIPLKQVPPDRDDDDENSDKHGFDVRADDDSGEDE